MSNNKVLFTVDGFDVLENATYRLRQKKDPSAPKEMKEKGYSKYPGAGDTIKCFYSQEGEVYDAGFEESSRFYLHDTSEERRTKVKNRRDNVLLPFLNSRGLDETRFRPSSIDDWDGFRVVLTEDVVFRTNDIKSRMELYIALISHSIVPPKANEEHYKYKDANFVLESSKIKVKAETENKKLKISCNSAFNELLKDKTALVDIFTYIGFEELSRSNGDDDLMIRYFEDRVLTDVTKMEYFKTIYNKYTENDEGKAEITIHRILHNCFKTKNKDFAKENGKILFKGDEIGQTEKQASEYLVTNTNMANTMFDIISNYDDKSKK